MKILNRGKSAFGLLAALSVLFMGGQTAAANSPTTSISEEMSIATLEMARSPRADISLFLDNMAAVISTISNKGSVATCSGAVALDKIPGISAKLTMAMQESKDDGKTWTIVKSKSYDSTDKSQAYSFQYYMTSGRCYRTLVQAQASKDGVPGRPVQVTSEVLYY